MRSPDRRMVIVVSARRGIIIIGITYQSPHRLSFHYPPPSHTFRHFIQKPHHFTQNPLISLAGSLFYANFAIS